jgi:hypothetical protein
MLLPALIGLLVSVAQPPDLKPIDSNTLTILCDPKLYRFSVRVGEEDGPRETSYPERTIVQPNSLIQMLPGWTGEPEVRGMLRRYVRCGPFSIGLEGAAYNSYIQSEMGAEEPFIAVHVLRGPRTAYHAPEGGGVYFTECYRGAPRTGSCPQGYAVRLDGRYDPERQRLVMTESVSSISDDKPVRTTRLIYYDTDLSSWHGEQE